MTFFFLKNCTLLLSKLQQKPSAIQKFKKFVGNFALLDPDPDPGTPLNPDPDPQHS
jgi:hypothetical protein